MVATHADVGDADLSNLCSADFDVFSGIKVDNMDRLRCRLSHRLNNHIVLHTFVLDIIQEAELSAILPNEHVLQRTLADLALKILPNVRIHE